VAFAFTFGAFLVLMAVLVVFVVRFAIQEGRRRKATPPALGQAPRSSLAARKKAAATRAAGTKDSRGRPGEASPGAARGPGPESDAGKS
jgi:hypothetical protein